MKSHFKYMDLLSFDTKHDWLNFQTLYGFTKLGRRRHYLTYGGGPEGGIVKFRGMGWHVWNRDWGTRAI
jgi:hypothetical protein